MNVCKRCELPENYPDASFDKENICRFCRDYENVDLEKIEADRKKREIDLEKALKDCKGKGEYDCLLTLSGGKDSAYLLYKLQEEYGLNVLTFTCDAGGATGKVALKNIEHTLNKLNTDHIIYTPSKDFYRKLWRFLLKNQLKQGAVRTVCYVCHPLTEGYALDLAVSKKIPLILEGFSPGQPDPDIMLYELPHKHITEDSWLPRAIKDSGEFTPKELMHFWDPNKYAQGTSFPRVLAPFHAWNYDQTEVMKKVVDLGLIPDTKHASPVNSNCLMNWLMMYSDINKLGYNPYIFEFCGLIRENKADKRYWRFMLKILNFMINHRIFLGRNVTTMMNELGIEFNDLQFGGNNDKKICSHYK